MNYPRVLHTFMFLHDTNIHINRNDELDQTNLCVSEFVCGCVLDTKPSHIQSKERKSTASFKVGPALRTLASTCFIDSL